MLRVVLPAAAPLLLGLGLAAVIHPAAGWLTRRLHLRPRGAALAAAGAVYLLAGAAVWLVCLLLWVQGCQLVQRLPVLFSSRVLPLLAGLGGRLEALALHLAPGSAPRLGQLGRWVQTAALQWGAGLSAGGMALLGRLLRGLPLFLLSLVFTLMTSLLAACDYPAVTGFLLRQCSPRGARLLRRAGAILTGSVPRMLRAYGLLSLATFAQLCAGLWLLGVPHFGAAALGVTLVDLLPVVGSGAVLVSWSLLCFAGGRGALGAGLLALWGIVSLVRGLLEPRVVGGQIGLHPLAALACMYLGLRAAGAAGMLGAPLLCLLLVRLQQEGWLRLWK